MAAESGDKWLGLIHQRRGASRRQHKIGEDDMNKETKLNEKDCDDPLGNPEDLLSHGNSRGRRLPVILDAKRCGRRCSNHDRQEPLSC